MGGLGGVEGRRVARRTRLLTLRLTTRWVRESELSTLLGQLERRPRPECLRRLRRAFAFSPAERAFARRLVERKTQLWVYRTNQHAFAGDFVVVDMSPGAPELRGPVVVELKAGEQVRRTPGPAAIQLERSDQAVAEIAGRDGVIVPGVEYGVLAGDPVEVLEALGVEKVPSIGAG